MFAKNTNKTLIIVIALILVPIALSLIANVFEKYKSYSEMDVVFELPSVKDSIIEFSVSPRLGWQDTGINVNKGDKIRIVASSAIQFDSDGNKASADGVIAPEHYGYAKANEGICHFLMCGDDIPSHSLVGRINNLDLKNFEDGFFIGTSATIIANKEGKLYLGFNDGFVLIDRSGFDSGGVQDNSGEFLVKIVVLD